VLLRKIWMVMTRRTKTRKNAAKVSAHAPRSSYCQGRRSTFIATRNKLEELALPAAAAARATEVEVGVRAATHLVRRGRAKRLVVAVALASATPPGEQVAPAVSPSFLGIPQQLVATVAAAAAPAVRADRRGSAHGRCGRHYSSGAMIHAAPEVAVAAAALLAVAGQQSGGQSPAALRHPPFRTAASSSEGIGRL